MKIFTIHTESHRTWFDIMQGSLVANCTDYELINKVTKQVSKTGEYGTDDIINFWYLKVLHILEILHTEDDPFLYSDTDIYFFRDCASDLQERLGGNDIVAQYEKHSFKFFPMVCAGFMYMKPNETNKKMFAWILKNMRKYGNDQAALNRYLFMNPQVKLGILPKTYYSINYDNGNKVWDGEDVKITVKDPFIAHIHWAIGLKTRLNLLEMIKRHYE